MYNPDSRGLEEAREAICRYYAQKSISLSPEQIFLTASTSEAYSNLFRLLTNAGDPILTPSISYPLFDFLSGLNDVRLSRYPLSF